MYTSNGMTHREVFGSTNPDFHDECVLLRMACFWKMGFHDNFLHSDMHRGNLLYRLDKTGASLQVVFLDAGVVSSIEDEQILKDFLHVLFAFRMEGMARIMIRCNMNPNADLYRFLVQVSSYRQVLRSQGVLTFDLGGFLDSVRMRSTNRYISGRKFTAGESDIDKYREKESSQWMNAIAQHLWIKNLENEETPFMEIPGSLISFADSRWSRRLTRPGTDQHFCTDHLCTSSLFTKTWTTSKRF